MSNEATQDVLLAENTTDKPKPTRKKTIEKATEAVVAKSEVKVEPKAEKSVEAIAKTVQKAETTQKSEVTTEKVPVTKTEKPVHVYDTIVIGAGISGIAAAYKMNQAGYHDYIVLEKASRVGGTWRDNN